MCCVFVVSRPLEAQEVLNEALNAIGPLEKEKGGGSTNAEAFGKLQILFASLCMFDYVSMHVTYVCNICMSLFYVSIFV